MKQFILGALLGAALVCWCAGCGKDDKPLKLVTCFAGNKVAFQTLTEVPILYVGDSKKIVPKGAQPPLPIDVELPCVIGVAKPAPPASPRPSGSAMPSPELSPLPARKK